MIIIAKKAIVSQKLSESHPLSECSILIGRENKSGFDFCGAVVFTYPNLFWRAISSLGIVTIQFQTGQIRFYVVDCSTMSLKLKYYKKKTTKNAAKHFQYVMGIYNN